MAFENENFTDYSKFFATNDLGLTQEIQKSIESGCEVVIGIYTSRECLLAAPIIKKHKVMVLSPTCGHDSIKDYAPHILTAAPSVEAYSKKIAAFAQKQRNRQVIAIYQPTDVFSRLSMETFKNAYKGTATEIAADHNGVVATSELKKMNSKQGKVVLFFTYPLPSTGILSAMEKLGVIDSRTLLVGSSSWTFDTSAFSSIKALLKKAEAALIPDMIKLDELKNTEFFKRYFKKFNSSPLGIHYVSYDLTRLAIQCYKRFLGTEFKHDAFRQCLYGTSYKGIAGDLRFTRDTPFANREILFLDLTGRL